MSALCANFIQGLVMRATKLNTCGAPVGGASGQVVSKGFVSVELKLDEDKGSAIAPVLADGTRLYYYTTPKNLNKITVSAEFCQVDPDLFNLITGAPLVLDDAVSPKSIGFTTDSASYATANFALEIWTNLSDGGCTQANGRKWGYYLLPWVALGSVDRPKIENNALNFGLADAITKSGNAWGTGPYNIQLSKTGVASPLFSPLSTTAHDLLMTTNLTPPTPVCGYQSVTLPT